MKLPSNIHRDEIGYYIKMENLQGLLTLWDDEESDKLQKLYLTQTQLNEIASWAEHDGMNY